MQVNNISGSWEIQSDNISNKIIATFRKNQVYKFWFCCQSPVNLNLEASDYLSVKGDYEVLLHKCSPGDKEYFSFFLVWLANFWYFSAILDLV